MTQQVFIAMFGPLPDRPTGLAMSVLRRAQAFAAEGTKTTILVDQFVPDIDRHIAGLQDAGQLAEGMIDVRSMHLDFAGRKPMPSSTEYVAPTHIGESGWVYTPDTKRWEVSRGRYEGDYREFVWMRTSKTVSFIDYLTDNGKRRLRRTWFDEAGQACKVELMNHTTNRPEVIDYCRPDGSVYLSEPQETSQRHLTLHDGRVVHFSSYDGMYEYWLRNFVMLDIGKPTIISEYGRRRNALAAVTSALDGVLIFTFHSSHYGSPYTYGSPTRPDQRHFLSSIEDLPALVVLTEEQRLDLLKEHGLINNLHVIPHHVPKVERSVVRDPNKIVMVGRFDKNKGHIDALNAFSRIREKCPSAYFEIYGRGPDEQQIVDSIEHLGLRDSVRIMGFTDDSAKIFAGAAVSFVTSNHEGFCLSLIESMAQGCVPISYGFKYGPADIMQNGKDGFIVAPGNISELADSAILLLSDHGLRNNMSTTARQVTERFTEQRLIDDWRSLFNIMGSGVLALG
ncbi:glycosyltransferase [Arthrobacter sp. zg-Y1219]|uniref:glycosyltransferase n=1 Tax=Arthrobacter sp. zg-Y1219 TaxID=3049067 RepID=UPI0024C3CB4A|nr:glycosyltransferase [Arthrobacter sp. zg-Y1219]MDK1359316.1 glycosyltransferase [Arthrobacter sp. zg-Y1219]